MALRVTKMTFPTEDDDDMDVDALRLAALQTLKKSTAQPVQKPNLSSNNNKGGVPRLLPHGGSHVLPNRGRGRGNIRRGRGRGFTNFHNGNNQGFFPNRPAGNSNLITIVPTVPDNTDTQQTLLNEGPCLSKSTSGNSLAVSSTLNEEEKVPAKFRRVDDDSDTEESEDDTNVKTESDAESSADDNDEEDDIKEKNSDSELDNDDDSVALQPVDDEGDNSLERLMRELEEEISDAPKDKQVASTSLKCAEKVSRAKKDKKDKQKIDKQLKEAETASVIDSSSDKAHPSKCSKETSNVGASNSSKSPSPQHVQSLKPQPQSPRSYQSSPKDCSPNRVWSPGRCRSPAGNPVLSATSTLQKNQSPHSARSPHRHVSSSRSRSPLMTRSPVKLRSPLRVSPLRSRSPQTSFSPRRSPPRTHAHPHTSNSPSFVHRSRSRSPCRSPRRSPRRSPHFSSRGISPGRMPPLRSRSRSPRLHRSRSRTPAHISYARRTRSRSPVGLARRSHSPSRRLSPLRRSRSRSPGGRLYAPRRSRSFSPRAPHVIVRSQSPRSRRSPSPYMKKLSPKRRSISPRRRSISPRRRSISPRRRSISPRRRSISPRRRPSSPVRCRISPRRSRSPVGSYSQRPLSPRRRSPFGDSYGVKLGKRSPSPVPRRYSPINHRVVSPSRNYRSPSPMTRSGVRRRSPMPLNGPSRRTPPRHRAPSPMHRLSPPRQTRIVSQKQLSPLPSSMRSNQRLPSPRRLRSPVPYPGGHHNSKTVSPSRKRPSPSLSLKRPLSPSRESSYPMSGRDISPSRSISLSPSPEREEPTKSLHDLCRGRKSQPLVISHGESKRSRGDLRSVLPRRRDLPKDSEASNPDETSKRDKRERKRAKRDRERHKRGAQQDANVVLEARRRKFECGKPVDVMGKRIRLRNMAADPSDADETKEDDQDAEINLEKEKERELKEASEVDESILDRVLMGGVDLLWSDEEHEEEEEEEDGVEAPPASNNVQFKRTFNMPSTSGSSGKENIPEEESKQKDEEEPSSTTGSPLGSPIMDGDAECEDFDGASDSSCDDQQSDKEHQDVWPKTNKELKEYILSQAKGQPTGRFPKAAVKESSSKIKLNETDVDLRAELSRRRAERNTKVNSCSETLPGRLLQSALQGAGVKARRDKSHRRRNRSPYKEEQDKQDSDGRRVLVLRRATEQKEPAINITISKVESPKESTMKATGKLPIHLRLGTGKKGDDSPKKVKLKRNVTVGRNKQV